MIPQTLRQQQFFWMIFKCSLFPFFCSHWKILKLIYLISFLCNFKSFILINVELILVGLFSFFQGFNGYTEKKIIQSHWHWNEIWKVHAQDMICCPKPLPLREYSTFLWADNIDLCFSVLNWHKHQKELLTPGCLSTLNPCGVTNIFQRFKKKWPFVLKSSKRKDRKFQEQQQEQSNRKCHEERWDRFKESEAWAEYQHIVEKAEFAFIKLKICRTESILTNSWVRQIITFIY